MFRQIPTVDVVPRSPSLFQDLFTLKRDFWYWSCNLLHCIQLITLRTRFNIRRLFTSESSNHKCSNVFRCVFGLEKTVVVCQSIIIQPTLKVVAMHCHYHILIWIVKQCCAVFASPEASLLSTDQVHVTKLPNVESILSSIHALDPSAKFVFVIFLTIFCGKSDVNKSLGCSMEVCSADVVVSQFQWFPFVRQTHRHHD